jgi:aerobic carbon-monoxide dehydrogenase medium subunit
MLPRRFQFHRPMFLRDLFDTLEQYGEDASIFAGGTELLIALKARVLHYEHLIDIKGIDGLSSIRIEDDKLIIGALATHHQISRHPLVHAIAPAYAQLSDNIANIRVRCAGTIAGNLCFAEPHADPPALLAALGARVRLEQRGELRELSVNDFIRDAFETERRPNEVLTAVIVDRPPPRSRAAYRRFGHLERPAVGAAAVVVTDSAGRICSEVRLWLSAIGSQPVRLSRSEAALTNIPVDAIVHELSESVEAEIDDVEASDDLHGSADYKRHLALTLLRRAVVAALPIGSS